MQAFLQRIINGGGVQRVVLELKIVYKSREATIQDSLLQTAAYAWQCGADEVHLLLFDRRPNIPWDEKIGQDNAHQVDGWAVQLWRL